MILPKQKVDQAVSLLEKGKYEEATTILEELGTSGVVASYRYDKAKELIEKKEYIAAYALLADLKDENSVQLAEDILGQCKVALIANAPIGSTVTYGRYEQDNNTANGTEEIEWIVLDKQDGTALLISTYALDTLAFRSTFNDATWEKCSLRAWLNDSFLQTAFSEDEQERIAISTVPAHANSDYGTDAGNATQDKVYLLSIPEVQTYFKTDSSRMCQPTNYCLAKGLNNTTTTNKCYWWLRTPGANQLNAAYVDYFGSIRYPGIQGSLVHECAVRPVIRVTLGS